MKRLVVAFRSHLTYWHLIHNAMKKYTCNLFAILFLSIVFVACKKGHEVPLVNEYAFHTGHGSITQDFGMCPICGGYFVVFDGDTSIRYRSLQNLDNRGVTSNSKFPLKATISWKPDTSIHVPNYIIITSIKVDQ